MITTTIKMVLLLVVTVALYGSLFLAERPRAVAMQDSYRNCPSTHVCPYMARVNWNALR